MTVYPTITGRVLAVGALAADERAFLAAVRQRYSQEPEWSEFAAWWTEEFRRACLPRESPTYRICQDLEARLGIAQGKVAPPDYRDDLADLIEVRYGACSRFCEATGLAPAQLGSVLASGTELSVENLQRILEALYAARSTQTADDLHRRPVWKPAAGDKATEWRPPFERIACLRVVLSESDFRSWLGSANEQLEGHSPIDLIRGNRADVVADLAEDMLTGSPT